MRRTLTFETLITASISCCWVSVRVRLIVGIVGGVLCGLWTWYGESLLVRGRCLEEVLCGGEVDVMEEVQVCNRRSLYVLGNRRFDSILHMQSNQSSEFKSRGGEGTSHLIVLLTLLRLDETLIVLLIVLVGGGSLRLCLLLWTLVVAYRSLAIRSLDTRRVNYCRSCAS